MQKVLRRSFLVNWLAAGVVAARSVRADELAAQLEVTAHNRKWRIGKPIVWYWAGPGSHNELNDTIGAQLAAGGWNLGWANKPEHLDIYHRHGLRAMVPVHLPNLNDPAQAKVLDETITWAQSHPATYAYYVADEPNAARFKDVAKVVSYLRNKDPVHVAVVNLYPTYASNEQLGNKGDTETAYRAHLSEFVKTVKPELLSYDHYPFTAVGSGQYFLNLALARQASLKAGVPLNVIIQASAFKEPGIEWSAPSEGQIRWQTYTSLAYGAQGICHFVYNARHVTCGLFKDAVTVTLKAPGAIDIFHAPTDVWTSSPIHLRAKLDLPPGGGVLARLK